MGSLLDLPHNNPEIVIAVLVENGGGGRVAAAPVAENVFSKFLEIRGKKLLNQIETWQSIQRRVMNQLHIDLPLMIAVLLASTVSAIAIFSASNSSEAFLTSHLIRIGLSILARF